MPCGYDCGWPMTPSTNDFEKASSPYLLLPSVIQGAPLLVAGSNQDTFPPPSYLHLACCRLTASSFGPAARHLFARGAGEPPGSDVGSRQENPGITTTFSPGQWRYSGTAAREQRESGRRGPIRHSVRGYSHRRRDDGPATRGQSGTLDYISPNHQSQDARRPPSKNAQKGKGHKQASEAGGGVESSHDPKVESTVEVSGQSNASAQVPEVSQGSCLRETVTSSPPECGVPLSRRYHMAAFVTNPNTNPSGLRRKHSPLLQLPIPVFRAHSCLLCKST
ncbi:hypothetical protein SKAU_G00264860 [Synaphobranchus kaupii]|uniref:Uncharacterized protein n=1 Tax=Synaphobranchus kaupii TaxID=118154 RepID=A0A9Q1IPS3_SYNKA|nr:hypothetical protein SKAU_G00264860 [Synaphobranchus kaupii]